MLVRYTHKGLCAHVAENVLSAFEVAVHGGSCRAVKDMARSIYG